MTTITALPAAPARTMDAPTFVTTADTFVAALPPMVTQINTVAGEINTNTVSALLSAQNASTSQIAAKLSEDNAQLYKTTAQSAAAAAQSAVGLPALKAGRVLRSPDGVNVEFGNVDGDVVYASQSKQIPLAKTVLANSINGLLEMTTPSNPQPDDWFVVADQGNANKNNVVIKRAGTNLISEPENISSGIWVKILCAVGAYARYSPYGTLTANSIISDSSTGDHYVVAGGLPQIANEYYTYSVYVKANVANNCWLQVDCVGKVAGSFFKLTGAGSFVKYGGSDTLPSTCAITLIGDGWYRISLTYKAPSTIASVFFGAGSDSNRTYTGNGSAHDLYMWGFKLELGTSATFYDPVTPSQNLIPYSAPKIAGWWNQTRVTALDNSAIAPDGSVTAVTITEDTNNSTHAIGYYIPAPSVNTYYTFSADVAPIGRNEVSVGLNFGGIYCTCWFDVLNGAIGGNSGAQNVTISKNPINGYYRISVSSPMTTNANAGSVSIYVSIDSGVTSYAGDGRAAIAVANVQLETGLIATPRIATNGVAATRTGNPTKIMGIADDLAIRRNYQNCRMTYQDNIKGWVLR